MTRMDKILGFDPETGVLEVEAGVQLGDLIRLFAPQGWVPAVVPGTGFPTVGGAIAHDIHGKNHHVLGSFGQHVLSVTLLQPGGNAHRGHARAATTPLFRATMGGIGQTGVIVSAKLQMIPTPGNGDEGERNPGRELRRVSRAARRLRLPLQRRLDRRHRDGRARWAAASSKRPSLPAARTRRAACPRYRCR